MEGLQKSCQLSGQRTAKVVWPSLNTLIGMPLGRRTAVALLGQPCSLPWWIPSLTSVLLIILLRSAVLYSLQRVFTFLCVE